MSNRLFRLAVMALILSVQLTASAWAEIAVQDSTGQTVTVSRPPKRVVSLVPHGTELFCMAGGCARLVAVSANSQSPAEVRKLPHTGPYNAVSLEGILSFQPDLVLAWPSGNPPDVLNQLERLKIPVYRTDPETIQEIATDLHSMARLSESEQGKEEAEQLVSGWKDLEAQYAARKPVPVFIHIWDDPLLTLNDQSIVAQVLKVCGAYNIFGDVDVRVPRISIENVITRQPALIVEGDHHQRQESEALMKYWQPYKTIPAVKNNHVFSMNGDYLLRPTPELLKGASELCLKVELARKQMK